MPEHEFVNVAEDPQQLAAAPAQPCAWVRWSGGGVKIYATEIRCLSLFFTSRCVCSLSRSAGLKMTKLALRLVVRPPGRFPPEA